MAASGPDAYRETYTTKEGDHEMIALETQLIPVDTRSHPAVAAALQETLVETLALQLVAKQAHWNLSGPLFRPLHLEFDEIAKEAQEWADTVAERMSAIGVAPDGRVQTVAHEQSLAVFPEGKIECADAARLIADSMQTIAIHVRKRITDGENDPLSQDVLVEIGRALEKSLWMLSAQLT